MPTLLARLRASEALVVLCGSTFLVMVGQGVVSPVLPLYATDFGVSTTVVGLTLTVFALARLIVNVPAGMVADRYGRRFLLVGGPIITSIGMFGSGLADDIWTLLAWRFVAGAGSAFYMSGAMIYLIDIAPPNRRARYVATNQWALSFGVAIGPGVGGLVAERYGLAVPFHLVGVTAILTAIYAVFRLPETKGMVEQPNADVDADANVADEIVADEVTAKSFVFGKQFMLIALVTASIFMVRAGTRATLMPLRAVEALGWGPAEIGLVFTLTGLMTLFTLMPAARAADSIGRRNVILFSGVAAGIGAMIVSQTGSATGFVIGNVVLSLGTGTAGPAPAAYVADIAPPDIRGLAVAFYRSAGDIGFLAAPPLLGLLAEATSIPAALGVSGVLVAGAAVVFLLGTKDDRAAGRQY